MYTYTYYAQSDCLNLNTFVDVFCNKMLSVKIIKAIEKVHSGGKYLQSNMTGFPPALEK